MEECGTVDPPVCVERLQQTFPTPNRPHNRQSIVYFANLSNAQNKNTTFNFNSTKETTGQLKQEAAEGPLGHRVKQPPFYLKIVLFGVYY